MASTLNQLHSSIGDGASILRDNVSSNISKITPELPTDTSSYSVWFKVLIAVFVLSAIGINVFGYAGALFESIDEQLFGPLRQLLGYLGLYSGEFAKNSAALSAEGTKFVADGVKNTVVGTVDAIDEQTKLATDSVDAELVKDEIPYVDRNELMMTFDAVKSKNLADKKKTKAYIADDAGSTIQAGGPTSGKGWCYIGEDRGFRSCMNVGENHECMSGDIFPTKDICINPSLRHTS